MPHKNLEAWKQSMDFVVEIYNLTKEFPKEEVFGLTQQMKRAAVSVPSNIAEGCARKGNLETIQFLYIAVGSLSELETQLIIAERVGYVHSEILLIHAKKIKMLLMRLIKGIRIKHNL